MEPSRYVRVEGDRIELFTPLSKLWLISVLGLLMIAASAAVVMIGDTASRRAIGWVGMALFGAATFWSARRLISPRLRIPTLVLDRDGVSVESPRGVMVPWEEIDGVLIRSMMRNRFLEIHVQDTDRVATRTKGRLARLELRANPLVGAAPVSIAANSLPIPLEDLIDLIEERCARTSATYPPPRPD
jgi:hypothetical protein